MGEDLDVGCERKCNNSRRRGKWEVAKCQSKRDRYCSMKPNFVMKIFAIKVFTIKNLAIKILP